MASEKPAPRTTVDLPIPATAEERTAVRKPIIGDDVWFFDETHSAAFSRMGAGPYAAKVTRMDATGFSLFVIGPQGGRFDVERVQHKSELPTGPGKRRWWEWPSRSGS